MEVSLYLIIELLLYRVEPNALLVSTKVKIEMSSIQGVPIFMDFIVYVLAVISCPHLLLESTLAFHRR